MNMHLFNYFLKWDKVCVSASHTPKLKLHIVPNVCVYEKISPWEIEKNVWTGMAHSTPPNLNVSTLVSEKQNTKITMENKKETKN
jgi:hypothetical protein